MLSISDEGPIKLEDAPVGSPPHLHKHHLSHLTLVTQLPNNYSSQPPYTRPSPIHSFDLLILNLHTTLMSVFVLCVLYNYLLLMCLNMYEKYVY
jgi:hypothetical protein